jgi:hypothetical protein
MTEKELYDAITKGGKDEVKKWRISRIQAAIDSRIQKLESDRAKIMSQAELIENTFTAWRNPILAATTFAASIILGLYSAGLLWNEVILPLLSIDISIGLASFLIFTILRGRIHSLSLLMNTSFLSAIDKLNYFRRYFNMETYFVENLELKKIDSYYNYNTFASLAVQVQLLDSYDKMAKSIFFKKLKNDLEVYLRETKESMDYGIEAYEEEKSSWNKYGINMRHLHYVHDDFFKYHGYKIDYVLNEISK